MTNLNLNSYIQLSSGDIIDLSKGVSFPFNFSVAEIQDISKRQGGYSKTLIAAGTANNRKIFGQLFKANVVDTSFDLNIRKKCFYVENGVSVFRGYLQLLRVNKISKNNIDGDGEVTFEVAIRDDAGDFYSILNDRYLNDLDFADMNHLFEWSGITSTSGHTWEDGYKYHQYQTSNTPNWYLEDFRPSIFAKQYFDGIFAQAGYTYTWSDLEDIKFDKMIVPYNGDEPRLREEETLADLFRAGYATGTTGQTFILTPFPEDNIFIFDDDSDSTRDFFDNSGNYDHNTGLYSITNHNLNTLVCKVRFEFYLSAATNCQFKWSGQNTLPFTSNYGVRAGLTDGSANLSTTSLITSTQVITSTISTSGTQLTAGLNLMTSGVTNELAWNNSTYGGIVDLYLGAQSSNNIGAGQTWRDGSNNIVPVKSVIKIIASPSDTNVNYYRNWINVTRVGQGQTIYMNDYVPQKIKQKDFIADVVKMFNLYITYDKDKNNHLIIKTRDNFYDEGNEIDISDLLDTEQEYSIQFLPDLQKKKLLFTYKDAGDERSKQYKTATNETYGQYEYTFDSEFVRDTLTIGNSLFEETPLDENISGNITSYITGAAPKSGVKILYDGGWIENTSGGTWSVSVFTTGSSMTTHSYSTYPYAGHFYPDPINPIDDLNWGLNDYLYYNDWDRLTLSNLYNKYYKRFVNQIENGKLLTGYFKLDEKFILNLDFSTKFYIHDSWWTLNKIIDYNGNGEQTLTKCEFISVDEGIRFNQQYITTGVTKPSPADWVVMHPRDLTPYNQIIGPLDGTVNVSGTKNTINSGVQYVDLKGSFNQVGDTKSVLITGDNNIVAGITNGFVLGDSNTATTSNSLIVGSNIDTSEGLEGVYTNNIILNSGGTIVVDGTVIISGGTFDFCDSGITTDQIYPCTTNGAVTFNGSIISDTSTTSGNRSISIGNSNNTISDNTTVFGRNNSITGDSSSIIGGDSNNVNAANSSVVGGYSNTNNGGYSVINGGYNNIITGGYNSTIGGGYNNTIFGGRHGIIGGYSNTINVGNDSFIGGGKFNQIIKSGYYNGIIGGEINTLGDSSRSVIIGGYSNSMTGTSSTISGGISNILSGTSSSIIGGNNNILIADRSAIIGGSSITGTTNDTVYVPRLNIGLVGPATPIFNLGLDINGFVVTGTSASGTYLPLSGGVMTGDFSADTITIDTSEAIVFKGTGSTTSVREYIVEFDSTTASTMTYVLRTIPANSGMHLFMNFIGASTGSNPNVSSGTLMATYERALITSSTSQVGSDILNVNSELGDLQVYTDNSNENIRLNVVTTGFTSGNVEWVFNVKEMIK